LRPGQDCGQYVRHARNAGKDDIASFFERVMAEDSERAQRCHEFLAEPAAPTTPVRKPDPTVTAAASTGCAGDFASLDDADREAFSSRK
jgi:hypothetical protein